jgi:hypothetical protein
MTRRLRLLHDRHRGARCVIVANGPSLNRMELGFLRREHVIGMNKIFLGFATFGFYPRYYVAVNPTVVQQSCREIRALRCVKFIGARAARETGLGEDALTYVVDTDAAPRFSTDLTQGLHEGWTVTHAALQAAYYLGFTDVVLIGLDHRYTFQGRPNEARVMEGADPNHFSERYFGHGQSWDNPDLERSEESYRVALEMYRRDGRRVRDATPDGACPVFPKADYRSVFAA